MSEPIESTKVERALLVLTCVAALVTACTPREPAKARPLGLERIEMEYRRDQFGFCYAKERGYSSAPVVAPRTACEVAEGMRLSCDTDTDCMLKNGGDGSP